MPHPIGDWNTQTPENKSVMGGTEYAMASQTMYDMAREDDPDVFQLSSDAGSMVTDTDGTASRRKIGSESDQGRKRRQKKHKGQGKGTA